VESGAKLQRGEGSGLDVWPGGGGRRPGMAVGQGLGRREPARARRRPAGAEAGAQQHGAGPGWSHDGRRVKLDGDVDLCGCAWMGAELQASGDGADAGGKGDI
jgi:hypothetical protein